MSKVRKILLYVTCFLFTSILAATATIHSAAALFENGASGTNFTIEAAQTHIVSYYNYSGSSWSVSSTEQVASGNTISSAPSISLSGYTFKGWVSAVPSNSNYTSYFNTSSQINNDLSLYPILESNNDYAYTNSTYYQTGVDVTISSSTIGSTQLGKRYVGIDGIPNPVATWNDSRSLYSASGIYKFVNEGGGAQLYRKVGFKPNSQWGQNWNGTGSGFGIRAWNDDNSPFTAHMGTSNGVTTLYAYVPATYINFRLHRYSASSSSFVGDGDYNKSANLSFDNSWWWNNSSTNRYTLSTIVLSMNYSSSWPGEWGSGSATWTS